jgi:hypothetical protein
MNEETIIDVEYTLSSLVGKETTRIYKDDEALYLEFSSDEDLEYLVIMGFFRFIGSGKIIFSASILDDKSRFDKVAEILSGKTIQEINVGDYGDITILFDEEIKLELISNTSYDKAMWNLAKSDGENISTFIVTPYACGRLNKKGKE